MDIYHIYGIFTKLLKNYEIFRNANQEISVKNKLALALCNIFQSVKDMNVILSNEYKFGTGENKKSSNIDVLLLLGKKSHEEIETKIFIDNIKPNIPPVYYLYLNLILIDGIKDKTILDDGNFIKQFKNCLSQALLQVALYTYNIYEFIPHIIEQLNRITRPNYVVERCNKNIKDVQDVHPLYTCGRAVIEVDPNIIDISRLNIKSDTKIIIYNTVSSWDDSIDLDQVLVSTGGGHIRGDKYYHKYIKYKTKYLNLKKL